MDPSKPLPELPDETGTLIASVPPNILEGLRMYALHRVPVGGFIRAVLENNLREAVCRADPESMRHLLSIVIYVFNALPSTCHGNPEAVKAWLKKGDAKP